LCFDTTASNTGKKARACILLEEKLQHNMLYFACRHHMMEFIIGAAFENTAGAGGILRTGDQTVQEIQRSMRIH